MVEYPIDLLAPQVIPEPNATNPPPKNADCMAVSAGLVAGIKAGQKQSNANNPPDNAIPPKNENKLPFDIFLQVSILLSNSSMTMPLLLASNSINSCFLLFSSAILLLHSSISLNFLSLIFCCSINSCISFSFFFLVSFLHLILLFLIHF